ncbi:DEAD/DEAH box helicase [Puniceibacterium sp. IMCC21224]|uniref:DEAD/DEAH box helicase n=1 Tax=Puniceibacterium sp. IMCC21224 TaxID=1618204 RepID=UPI00064DA2B0|nr:DEAD/DEAH box helicase [Puniceibacterium sp. IMCC21224]
MYDDSTRRLLQAAPNLDGLDAAVMDELLTQAHIALATARVEAQDDGAAIQTLDRVRRLAATFEAYVVLGLKPDQTRAAAFVAASAHQIIAQTADRRGQNATLLSSDAVDATLSSTLLFLIAERTADAAEAAVRLKAKGEKSAVRRSLILTVREFARNDLEKVTERDLDSDTISDGESREIATDLLYRECTHAIRLLACEAIGKGEPGVEEADPVLQHLNRVVELALATEDAAIGEISGPIHFNFAGPYHLANLIYRLVGGVRSAMLITTPSPSGANPQAWQSWLETQARARPFLWTNHLKAVGSGYLDRGRSMVMTSPTGSGKTTLSVLKIAATRCANESVIYLAPTHALVDQVETDLSGEVGNLETTSVEELDLDDIGDRLPAVSVMTPERCLALLGAAPELFDQVGLLVFDEFHLIGASGVDGLAAADGRAVDAMLALMTFIARRPNADLLLLSAMVSNGREISDWLGQITNRNVDVFDDPWKPTRQLRSCVIYDRGEVSAASLEALAKETATARETVPARPYGLFSLVAGWHPTRTEKLVVRPLTDRTPPLKQTPAGRLKSNRNVVAAEIASDFAAAGKRVIVFCENPGACSSVARTVNSLVETANIPLDETQAALQEAILIDIGSPDAAFSAADKRATVHHGDLLPIERRLTESVFRAHGRTSDPDLGLSVIAATSTIAQGLNLPCDVVILAGTDRSTADDPSGNPRSDLQPHEILNALGRAGRAAYAATGVAIVVPAYVIPVDTTNVRLHPLQAPLPIVFSGQDACDAILDPIAMLLDQIEIDGDTDPRTQAMIRRLTAVTEDGNTGFDRVAKSSLGFHVRRARNEDEADEWLEARRGALAAAAARLVDPPVLDWQQDLAVRNGVPPEIIERLNAALSVAPIAATTTTDWISWLLDSAVKSPKDLTLFIRKASLDTVFNRSWKNHPDPAAATGPVVEAIKTMASMWCAGRSLIEIEAFVLAFVQANEVNITQPARRSKTAQRARRFAIRILPDIGFLCGLFAQIVAHRELEDNSATQQIVPMLQRMIKAGDHDRHQAILRLEARDPSRVRSFKSCEDMRPRFTAGPMDTIEVVQNDIRTGIAIQMFSALDP